MLRRQLRLRTLGQTHRIRRASAPCLAAPQGQCPGYPLGVLAAPPGIRPGILRELN
jgi:hypothetical protein